MRLAVQVDTGKNEEKTHKITEEIKQRKWKVIIDNQ